MAADTDPVLYDTHDGETMTESHYLVNSECSDMEDLAMALIAAANVAPNAPSSCTTPPLNEVV